jgi:hypothetical protein
LLRFFAALSLFYAMLVPNRPYASVRPRTDLLKCRQLKASRPGLRLSVVDVPTTCHPDKSSRRTGLGSSGTENRPKDSRYSLSVSSALRKGRSWSCATESGSANAYRPKKLMCSNMRGESRPTSSGFIGYPITSELLDTCVHINRVPEDMTLTTSPNVPS